MKPFIFGSLSALLVLTAIAPAVQAQSGQRDPGGNNRPGMPGETDQGVPGVTDQRTPGDPDQGGTNQSVPSQTSPSYPNQSVPNQRPVTPGSGSGTPYYQDNDPSTPDPVDRGVLDQPVIPNTPSQTVPGATPTTPGTTNQQRTPGSTSQSEFPAPEVIPGTRSAYLNPLGSTSLFRPTAFNLVNLARNGYLESAGIPSGGNLASSYREGEIEAEDLIQAAISVNRLPADYANDSGYRYAVDRQLWGLLNHINDGGSD